MAAAAIKLYLDVDLGGTVTSSPREDSRKREERRKRGGRRCACGVRSPVSGVGNWGRGETLGEGRGEAGGGLRSLLAFVCMFVCLPGGLR